MNDFWKKYRETLVVIGFLLGFAGIFRFGVVLLYKQNAIAMNAIQEERVDRKILSEQTEKIPEMRSSAEMIETSRDQLDVLLPKDGVVSLIESIESLGSMFGVSVSAEAVPEGVTSAYKTEKKSAAKKEGESATDPQESSSNDTGQSSKNSKDVASRLLPALPFDRLVFVTIKATGEYPDVVRFLAKLDASPKLLDVLSVSFAPEEKESSSQTATKPVLFSGAVLSDAAQTEQMGQNELGLNEDSSGKKEVIGSFFTVIYLAS